jgi:hypothetical protein
MSRALLAVTAVVGLAAASTSASASVLYSWAFNNLNGSFARNTGPSSASLLGTFTASASAGTLQSSGNLSRNVSPLTQATFRPGFLTLDAGANVQLIVTVENPFAGSASGTGTLVISDSSITTDTISANFTGTWSVFPGGGVFFNASSVSYTIANPSGDSRFNGSEGTSADLTGFIDRSLSGALNQLFLDISAPSTVAQAFGASFQNVATTATGQIIPAPGAVALLGLGGLVAARRRRN